MIRHNDCRLGHPSQKHWLRYIDHTVDQRILRHGMPVRSRCGDGGENSHQLCASAISVIAFRSAWRPVFLPAWPCLCAFSCSSAALFAVLIPFMFAELVLLSFFHVRRQANTSPPTAVIGAQHQSAAWQRQDPFHWAAPAFWSAGRDCIRPVFRLRARRTSGRTSPNFVCFCTTSRLRSPIACCCPDLILKFLVPPSFSRQLLPRYNVTWPTD
jgi:hypothetical protein